MENKEKCVSRLVSPIIVPNIDIVDQNENSLIANSVFEVLATFRYDPGFTQCLSSKEKKFEIPDTRLGLRDQKTKQQITNKDYLSYLQVHKTISGNGLLKDVRFPDAWKNRSTVIECQCKDDILKIIYERFFLLDEQYQRMRLALSYFKIGFNTSLEDLFKLLVETLIDCKEGTEEFDEKVRDMISQRQCYKMRVLVSKTGSIRMEAVPLPMEPIFDLTKDCDNVSTYFIETMLNGFLNHGSVSWDVVISSESINRSAFTSLKTTSRGHYTAARARMQAAINKVKGVEPASPVSQCEVLLSNKSGQLMEGSITNVAVIQKDPDGIKKYVTPRLTSGCLCGTMRHYLLRLGLIEEGDIKIESLAIGDEVLLFNGVMGCIKGKIKVKY